LKTVGIISAVASIFLITNQDKTKGEKNITRILWLFPAFTFIGSSIIDMSFFYVSHAELADSTDVSFVAFLFFVAGLIGIIISFLSYLQRKKPPSPKDLIAGIALGVPNFFSIYLLFLVLTQGLEATVVFPINNVGILLVSAFFGIVIFAEKMNSWKIFGFALAVISIILIANG